MKNKQIFIGAIVLFAFSSPLFSAQKHTPSKKPQPNPNQQLADDPMLSQNQCSGLTQDEQNFAKNLNDMNMALFCSKMTSVQRQKAMQMTNVRGSNGNKMSPDDAVQNVMGQNGRSRGSGSCPVH